MKKCFFLFFLIFSYSIVSASVSEVIIESSGVASSRSLAINEALLEAISKSKGKKLSSETELKIREATVSLDNKTQSASVEEYAKKINEATSGAVLGYEILKEGKSDAGLYEVTLAVRIPEYKNADATKRKKIAVASIKADFSAAKFSGQSISAQEVAKALEQSLNISLTNTRKFAILDRSSVADVEKELALASTDKVNIAESARLGNKLVADYVLSTSIPVIQYVIKEKSSRLDERTIKYAEGYGTVVYKLIEVATGQIASSDKLSYSMNHDSNQIMGSNTALSSMTGGLANKISNKIHEQIYPITLVDYDNGSVVLNQGSGLLVGEVYKVYRYSGKLVDPYTKETIGKKETYCCDVKIERTNPKQAYGKIVNGKEQFDTNPYEPKTFILREKVPGTAKAPQVKKKINEIKQSIKKEDDEW